MLALLRYLNWQLSGKINAPLKEGRFLFHTSILAQQNTLREICSYFQTIADVL